VSNVKYCPHCGEQLAVISNFCSKCGKSLKELAVQASETNYRDAKAPDVHEESRKSILDDKRYNFALLGVVAVFVLVIFIVVSNGNSVEKKAIQTVKDRITAEGYQYIEEISFYDIKTQLRQKEDRDIEQEGIISVSGRIEYKEKGSKDRHYRYFSTSVDFYDGVYYAGTVYFDTDNERYKNDRERQAKEEAEG
jgi:hypothetical protein